MYPKISVAIITYNQEKLIGRALESVLSQKEYVYEIIVSDDCSTDNNWLVIMEYYKKYPNIINPFRQKENLGINRNLEFVWSKSNGDLMIPLSGDDELCNGLFIEVINLIHFENIDFHNESFVIYADYESITPNGEKKRWSNHLISKKYNPISLKIRGLINNRTTIISKSVYEKFHLIRPDLGMFADGLIDIQTQMYANQNYYIPFIGSKYYSNIGVSVHGDLNSYYKTRIEANNEMIRLLKLNKKDKHFMYYINSYLEFCINPSVDKFFNTWKYFFKSIYIAKEANLMKILRRIFTMILRFINF